MIFTLAIMGLVSWIPGFVGSHLLGAFGAGMCFVNVPRSHSLWQAQFKRIVRWLVKIFFAATVGFSVPVKEMLTGKSLGYGLILGVGPVIGCKIISGLFAPMKYANAEQAAHVRRASWATKIVQPQQLLVGMAMVARGEFAYLVANEAQAASFQGGYAPSSAFRTPTSPLLSPLLSPPLSAPLSRSSLRSSLSLLSPLLPPSPLASCSRALTHARSGLAGQQT